MHPPKRAIGFLRWFCREDYLDEIEGDLTELFQKEHPASARRARFNFSWRVLKYFRPGFIRSFNPSTHSTGMYNNYFKIAWRNLLNRKSFSSLNIMGLSIGMTCCLIIFQYVAFESSFDRFHENKDDLYRVLRAYARGNEPMTLGHSYTPQALSPALKAAIPEIENISRVHDENAIVFNPETPAKVFEENEGLYVDEGFMKMFTFPLVSGSAELKPGNILISEATAKKYFGDTPAEGQTLDITGNTDKTYTIAGVFKDVPTNSHLQFTMLLPMQDLVTGPDYATEPEGGWSWNNFTTYVQLHPQADRAAVRQKMTDLFLKYRGDVLKQQGGTSAINLQPLDDIHLNSEVEAAGAMVSGSYKTLYFFLVIGLITLVIALVNYINLATARALNRAREVGVRKAVGAKRQELMGQFLYESAFTNISAMIIALVLTFALLPVVNDIAETQLSITQWIEPLFLLALGGTLITGTLLAGLYPALVLSSFRPAAVLKGKSSPVSGHFWLRKGLVVVQFTACVVLIAGTVIVFDQLRYARSLELGLDLKQVVSISAPRILSPTANRATVTATFLDELRKLPDVEGAAVSSTLPGQGFNWNGASIRKVSDDPSKALQGVATYIDSAFASLYGLDLVAGKEFNKVTVQEDSLDSSWKIMVNEATVKSLGFMAPADIVDEELMIGDYRARVIGVYKNFKWSSAHQAQQNIVFGRTRSGRNISVKVNMNNFGELIRTIESTYNAMFPGNLFSYTFVDDAFALQYKNDERFAKLFSIFAGMAIFIACLGLFGLVAFTAQQRTKEIGMRKVLGASVSGIVTLLSKDFLVLVLTGYVAAIPITLYIMNQWLENFADRISIGAGVFVVAGLLALLVAICTVSWQSFKAAVANPVKSLRSE